MMRKSQKIPYYAHQYYFYSNNMILIITAIIIIIIIIILTLHNNTAGVPGHYSENNTKKVREAEKYQKDKTSSYKRNGV